MLSARLAEIVQWLGHLVVAVKTWVRFPVSAALFAPFLKLILIAMSTNFSFIRHIPSRIPKRVVQRQTNGWEEFR
jgi:hypothetical protein